MMKSSSIDSDGRAKARMSPRPLTPLAFLVVMFPMAVLAISTSRII